MKYINKFDTHSEYTEDKSSLGRPSVNYCVDENHVHYDNTPTIITVNLNVTAETQSDFVAAFTDWRACDSVLLDGEPVDFGGPGNVITFTVGEHVVEYMFPHTTVCPGMGYSGSFSQYMDSVIIPEGIKRIERIPCTGSDTGCPSIRDMGGTLSIPSTLEYVDVGAICDTITISQEDRARLDSCCPEQEQGGHPWRAFCGK